MTGVNNLKEVTLQDLLFEAGDDGNDVYETLQGRFK
jgi:hypothetical protein